MIPGATLALANLWKQREYSNIGWHVLDSASCAACHANVNYDFRVWLNHHNPQPITWRVSHGRRRAWSGAGAQMQNLPVERVIAKKWPEPKPQLGARPHRWTKL